MICALHFARFLAQGLLVLALVLGIAPAAPAQSGLIAVDLCGTAAGSILIDPNGNPALPHHHCPDCLPSPTAAALLPPLSAATMFSRLPRMIALGPFVLALPTPPATSPHPPARAPPFSV